jgi:hypothetical protein
MVFCVAITACRVLGLAVRSQKGQPRACRDPHFRMLLHREGESINDSTSKRLMVLLQNNLGIPRILRISTSSD